MSNNDNPVAVGLGFVVFGAIISSLVFQSWKPVGVLLCCFIGLVCLEVLFKGSGS